ncbi:MAG: 16S rRNA (guanine(966)-N(2))-methyltransferase RsmD [Bryobacteraceae bacterium]
MRVIGGRFRSRKLKSVPGLGVRPTPDRLREALFNVLASRLERAVFLDGYAGSGAVGIEALSRGAQHVILIERNAHALAIIRENLRSLGIDAEATLVRGNAATLLRNYRADIAFIDPPYEQTKEYPKSLLALSETACPLVVAQHASRAVPEDVYGAMKRTRILKQGDNSLSFYEQPASASAAE